MSVPPVHFRFNVLAIFNEFGHPSRWFADQGWSFLVVVPQSERTLVAHDFHNTVHLQDLMKHQKITTFRLCRVFMQKEPLSVNLVLIQFTQESQVSKSVMPLHSIPWSLLPRSANAMTTCNVRMQGVRMVSLSSDTRGLSGEQLLC